MSQRDRLLREKGPDHQNWMTSSELCSYLNINPRTLRRWNANGKAEPEVHTISGWGLYSPAQQVRLRKELVGS